MSEPPKKEGGDDKGGHKDGKPDTGMIVVAVVILFVVVFSGVIPELFRQISYAFQAMRMHGGAIMAIIGVIVVYKLFSSNKKDDHH